MKITIVSFDSALDTSVIILNSISWHYQWAKNNFYVSVLWLHLVAPSCFGRREIVGKENIFDSKHLELPLAKIFGLV